MNLHLATDSTIDLVTATWIQTPGLSQFTLLAGICLVVLIAAASLSFSFRSYVWGAVWAFGSLTMVAVIALGFFPQDYTKVYVEAKGTVKSVTRIPADSFVHSDQYGLRLEEHPDVMFLLDRADATAYLGNNGAAATVYCEGDESSTNNPQTLVCYGQAADVDTAFWIGSRPVPDDAHITRKPYTPAGGEQ